MTAAKLATIIERALVRSAPKGRNFYITSTQAQKAAEAVLIALQQEKDQGVFK